MIFHEIESHGIDRDLFYLTYQGRQVKSDTVIMGNEAVCLHRRLHGGMHAPGLGDGQSSTKVPPAWDPSQADTRSAHG